MPLPINVEDLLYQRKVERTRIEYKEGWNPEPIIHTITAFANDFDNMGGGYILIGVEEENGRPVFPIKGLNPDSIDSIQQDILNKCNRIVPRFIPVISVRNSNPLIHKRSKGFLFCVPQHFLSVYALYAVPSR